MPGAARAVLMNAMAPLIGVPLAIVFLRERVTLKIALWMCFALFGECVESLKRHSRKEEVDAVILSEAKNLVVPVRIKSTIEATRRFASAQRDSGAH